MKQKTIYPPEFQHLIEATHHGVDSYESCLADWTRLPKFESCKCVYPPSLDGFEQPIFIARVVKEEKRFQPLIQDAELIRVTSEDGKPDRLRLQLTGQNLLQIVLEKSNFNLGFPFPKSQDKCQVK
jgi:hypothetical protein